MHNQIKQLQGDGHAAPVEYMEDMGGAQAPSIDFFGILLAVLRRWKLIASITLFALIATYGVLTLVPSRYKSTVEILIYDPQQQINVAVQKPIFPFVDAANNDAMSTEINIIKSKALALRVASELDLAQNPEYRLHNLPADLAERLGFPDLGRALNSGAQTFGGADDEKAENLDQAADALLANIQVWSEAYVLFVTTTSQSPTMAQRLASTIAMDHLASQREARQKALLQVATWLKSRVDNLLSRVLESEASIEKLKSENNIHDNAVNNLGEQRIGELNAQLIKAHAEVDEKRARLEQVRSVIDAHGDVLSIPELTASPTLTTLRQKQAELKARATDLQAKLGEGNLQVITIRAGLAAIGQQIDAEAEHFLGNIKYSYEIAVRQEQSLQASLQTATAHINSEAGVKLQQLQRVADADRKLYESYLSQYNDISERRTLQDASARIISPATLPRSPSSPRRKLFYLAGGALGFGGGFLLAFLLEYRLRPGVRTGTEIEQSFGRPVVGTIPFIKKIRGPFDHLLLRRMVGDPHSVLSEAVHSMRISLELSNSNSKVILITSALPGEGKSTMAMLLAASSAHSGKRTILVDCDLHQQPTSDHPGLSELLLGGAELADVITQDPVAKTFVVRSGATVPNAADLLMSQRMRDLIVELRSKFDYIVIDTPPLLPVVDALVLTTVADRILVVVEWSQTPRASISEVCNILRPEAHRVAGIVLTKVDFDQQPRYGYRGTYPYGYVDNHASNG